MAHRRTRRPPARGTTRGNKYAGDCTLCGATVEPMAGVITYRDGWQLTHRPMQWAGSPVSGSYVGGCPGDADDMNARLTASHAGDTPKDRSDAAVLDEIGGSW